MTEFDLKKVYVKEYSKKELIKIIEETLEERFQVVFLPKDKNGADILIRDIKK